MSEAHNVGLLVVQCHAADRVKAGLDATSPSLCVASVVVAYFFSLGNSRNIAPSGEIMPNEISISTFKATLASRPIAAGIDCEDFVPGYTGDSGQSRATSNKSYEDYSEPLRSPTSTCSSIITLKEQILDALEISIHEQRFLPADEIDALTESRVVLSEFQEKDLDYTSELIEFASGPGRRLFLILVQIDHLGGLMSLYNEGFDDSHLPVDIEKRTREKKRTERRRLLYEVGSIDEGSNTLKPGRWQGFMSELWDNSKLEQFVENQWLFLAPVFAKGQFHHIFHRRRPFRIFPTPAQPSRADSSAR